MPLAAQAGLALNLFGYARIAQIKIQFVFAFIRG
jgi:hypothetical protein